MNQPQPERQGDGLREKVLAVFDKVIVDPAGVINAPQLTDEICRIVRRWEKPVVTEDDGTREPIPDGWQPPTDTPPSSIIGAEGAGGSIAMSCCATDEQITAYVADRHPAAPPKPAPDAMRDGNPDRRCAHGKLFTESCPGCGYVHPRDRIASAPVPDAMRIIEDARQVIVLTIAFLGRDTGTERAAATIKSLIGILAKADAGLRAALSAVPSPDGAGETIPLADHDEIWRKVLNLPWDVQKAIVTITAHCRVLKDEHETGKVADLAGCISHNCMELADALSPATGAAEPVTWPPYVELPLTFQYRNHRGEVATRTVFPISIRFGTTEWHQEAQWLLKAFDRDKQAEREFAMRDISAAPLVRGDRETVAVPAVAPEPCPCCGGKLHLNGANYSCDKNSSMSFHLDDLSLPVQPDAIEPSPDMCIAGGIAIGESLKTCETYADVANACWKAMQAAK